MFSVWSKNTIRSIYLLTFLSATAFGGTGRTSVKNRGEFSAGTFILTQQSLLEAPYRYAGILRDVLDRVESKQPPSQSDEENCDVKYRIEPSGEISIFYDKKDLMMTLSESE